MRASSPQLPGRDKGRDHQRRIEKNTGRKKQKRKFRQQMDLAIVLNHSKAKQQGWGINIQESLMNSGHAEVRSGCLCASDSNVKQCEAAQRKSENIVYIVIRPFSICSS